MANNYKNRNKPITDSDKVKYHQGYYIPINVEKCLTKENIYRSGWEKFFMQWCDINPNILRWASEPFSIKYRNPIANRDYCIKNGFNPDDPRNWKVCNYYTDFWCEMVDNESPNGYKRILIEIKPHAQTVEPKPLKENASRKEIKAYINAAQTYAVNIQKWNAAKEYCESIGYGFMVMTEVTLKKLGMVNS